MIVRVYREASRVLENLVIASGDWEIGAAARQYGAQFVLTTEDHMSGTSRCIEAMRTWTGKTGKTVHSVLNIQGDEPMVTPDAIARLAEDILRPGISISTLIRRETDQEAFVNPNRVKVVLNNGNFALYFSRSPVPHFRNALASWFSHVGMYAFKMEILEEIGSLQPGILETAESLEQLRWLENGYMVHCCETDYAGFGIDTPGDLEALLGSGLIG